MSTSSGDVRHPSAPDPDRALALVHDGWSHLQRQQPQAAWASWQRALRVAPGFPAASEALDRLETADDLPAAARAVYRFEAPDAPDQRARWNERIAGDDLEELTVAADRFASLAAADPTDAAAWYDRALCLAWMGRNAEAVTCLDQFVQLRSPGRPESAETAWTLAEILRQGGGAEPLADDLRYLWTIPWSVAETPRLLAGCSTLQAMPSPRDPVTGELQFPDAQVYEWLDRPPPEPSATLRASDLPRLLATVVVTPQALRLSSPDPATLEQIREPISWVLDDPSRPIRREAAPLPLSLLDAAVWTFRPPPGLEPETQGRLAREAVEHYYENLWIHQPRQGLGDLTPLQASRLAAAGDPVARARLAAVVRLREQLGARTRTAALYQGYPFDRLRRRLGLPCDEPAAVNPADASCMSEPELDRLDPGSLDDEALAEAFFSASGLRDDARTARFAAPLALKETAGTARAVDPDLFAVLVREAMRAGDLDRAFEWLDRAGSAHDGRDRPTYEIWRAEILARSGDPDAAFAIYQGLLDEAGLETPRVVEAAEDLLQAGAVDHACRLLDRAAGQAEREADSRSLARIRRLAAIEPPRSSTDRPPSA